jgi:hypothetical protein
MRRMFGSEKEEVARGWRRLHNEELHNLYASSNVLRVMKLRRMSRARHVVRVGEMRNAYKNLAGKPERKKPLGRPRHRWEDNIRVNPTEIGWEGLNWIHLAQDKDQWRAVVITVINLRVT